jgi:hypothetical protein
MTRARSYIWIVGAFCIVFAASLAPRFGFELLAPLASLITGAVAAVWLGHAARESAPSAARASAITGVGCALATVAVLPLVTQSDTRLALLGGYSTLLVGVGLALVNLLLSILGGALAWLAVGESPLAEPIAPGAAPDPT